MSHHHRGMTISNELTYSFQVGFICGIYTSFIFSWRRQKNIFCFLLIILLKYLYCPLACISAVNIGIKWTIIGIDLNTTVSVHFSTTSKQGFNFPWQTGDTIHISMVFIDPKHQFKRLVSATTLNINANRKYRILLGCFNWLCEFSSPHFWESFLFDSNNATKCLSCLT